MAAVYPFQGFLVCRKVVAFLAAQQTLGCRLCSTLQLVLLLQVPSLPRIILMGLSSCWKSLPCLPKCLSKAQLINKPPRRVLRIWEMVWQGDVIAHEPRSKAPAGKLGPNVALKEQAGETKCSGCHQHWIFCLWFTLSCGPKKSSLGAGGGLPGLSATAFFHWWRIPASDTFLATPSSACTELKSGSCASACFPTAVFLCVCARGWRSSS